MNFPSEQPDNSIKIIEDNIRYGSIFRAMVNIEIMLYRRDPDAAKRIIANNILVDDGMGQRRIDNNRVLREAMTILSIASSMRHNDVERQRVFQNMIDFLEQTIIEFRRDLQNRGELQGGKKSRRKNKKSRKSRKSRKQ
jgi:hypothetical protein